MFLILTLANFLSEKDINTPRGWVSPLLPPAASPSFCYSRIFGTAGGFFFFFFVMLFIRTENPLLIWILVVVLILAAAMGIAHFVFGRAAPD